jgi:hypothetical protein
LYFRYDEVVHMADLPFETITHIPLIQQRALLPACRLVMALFPDRVYALVVTPKDEIVGCREYRNRGLSGDMFLRFIFEKDPLIRGPFLDCRVYMAGRKFALLPDHAQVQGRALTLARILLDEVALEQEVIQGRMPQDSGTILFTEVSGRLQVLNHYLKFYSLNHLVAPLLGISARLAAQAHSFVLAHVSEGSLVLTAYRQGRLHLCNEYRCNSVMDQVYFIQAVRQALHLLEAPVYLSGESAAQHTSLRTWLPGLETPDLLRSFLPAEGHQAPYWKFAFLAESIPV